MSSARFSKYHHRMRDVIGTTSLNKLLRRDGLTTTNASGGASPGTERPQPSSAATSAAHNKVRYFHKVLFRHKLKEVRKIKENDSPYSSTDLASQVDLTESPELYLCFCEQELVLVDPFARWAPFRPNFGPGSPDEYIPIPAQYRFGDSNVNPHIIFALPYDALTEVVADRLREEVFGLGIAITDGSSSGKKATITTADGVAVEAPYSMPYQVPFALRFAASFRKQIVENLQICYKISATMTRNEAAALPTRFASLDVSQKRETITGVEDKRLATFQYMSPSRLPPDMSPLRMFYRADYMFMGPQEMTDRYEALPNRPCSTYVIHSAETRALERKGRVAENAVLIATFNSARHLSDMASLTRGRDALGQALTSDDELKGVQVSPAGTSNLDFYFWVESIAHALTSQEATKDQYFIPEKGVYHKKANIVSDKCAWTCFRVHIFTPHRQIGVMGCRRSFLPPFADTFQDMVFVLYGPRNARLKVDPAFMQTLDTLVDSLSPAVAPLPYKEYGLSLRRQITEMDSLLKDHSMAFAKAAQGVSTVQVQHQVQHQSLTQNSHRAAIYNTLKTLTVHPTYYDRWLIQMRANTLLYTPEQLRWLSTRDFLSELESPVMGVVPRTKFIDVECYELATKFCQSVLGKLKGGIGAGGKEDTKVSDPLSIIVRLMAELEQEEEQQQHEVGLTLGAPGASAGPKRNVETTTEEEDLGSGYSLREEWRARISLYFAFCVDGGVLPDELTMNKLVTADVADDRSVDRIIDFLLYMKKKPRATAKTQHGYPYMQFDSVVERMAKTDVLNGFSCNEEVLKTLIETSYVENSARRLEKMETRKEDRVAVLNVIPRLYRSVLVTKLYNLELVRTVCRKIQMGGKIINDEMLLDPLVNLVKVGNFYLKAWAFQALAALATQGHELAIFSKGGVGMAIWWIYVSRSSELIEAAIDLLIAVSHTNKLRSEPYVVLTQPDLTRKMIHFLVPFDASTPLQERHHPRLLERASTLITKLAPDREVLGVLLENLAHHHLARLVARHNQYHHILIKVTSAMGTIYLHAGEIMARPRYSPKRLQEEDALALVSTLRDHVNAPKIQLCLNILIALRMIIDFWLVPLGEGASAYRRYWPAVQNRVELLLKLKDKSSLDRVLNNLKRVAEEVVSSAQTSKLIMEQSREYEHFTEKEKVQRRTELDTQIKIGNGIIAKVAWFVAVTEYCKVRDNSAKNFQHDGKTLQPLGSQFS